MQKSWGSGSDRERRMGWLALAAGMGSVFVGTRILAPAASALLDRDPSGQATTSAARTVSTAESRFHEAPSHPPQPEGEPATQSVTVSPDPTTGETPKDSTSLLAAPSASTDAQELPAQASSDALDLTTSAGPGLEGSTTTTEAGRSQSQPETVAPGRPTAADRREFPAPVQLPSRESPAAPTSPTSTAPPALRSDTRFRTGLPAAVGPVFVGPTTPKALRGKDPDPQTAIPRTAQLHGESAQSAAKGIRLAPPRASEPLPDRERVAASATAGSTPGPDPSTMAPSQDSLVKVHFGSVGSRKEATALKERLERTAGLKARIVRDGSGYRVQLGAFRDRANAAKLVDDLKAKRFQPQLEEGKITSPPVEAAPAAPEEP